MVTYQAKAEDYLEENFHILRMVMIIILRVSYQKIVFRNNELTIMRNIVMLNNHHGRPCQRRGGGCRCW